MIHSSRTMRSVACEGVMVSIGLRWCAADVRLGSRGGRMSSGRDPRVAAERRGFKVVVDHVNTSTR